MAKFADLATELVLAITSHIPRSADKLQLVLVNRKMHRMIAPQLFRCIHLGQSADTTNRGCFPRVDGDSCWDTVRLRHLSRILKDTPPTHTPIVESLSLELNSDTLHESFKCSDIMLYLPNLKILCLSTKRLAGHEGRRRPSTVSPFEIRQELQGVSGTLEILIIDIEQDQDFRDARSMGSFRHFIALKHLSIQSHILFGDRGEHFDMDSEIVDGWVPFNMTMFTELPPRLQELQISWWMEEDECVLVHTIAGMLEDLMKESLDALPELQEVTVYYPAKYLDLDPSVTLEELGSEVDNMREGTKYIIKGCGRNLESC